MLLHYCDEDDGIMISGEACGVENINLCVSNRKIISTNAFVVHKNPLQFDLLVVDAMKMLHGMSILGSGEDACVCDTLH